jgi:hypothetical protein
MKRIIGLIILTLSILLFACSGSNNNKDINVKPVDDKKLRTEVPLFDADSAYIFVKTQVDMGPRLLNGPVHEKCAKWLEAKLKSYGAEVTFQNAKLREYNGAILNSKNIIGAINPKAAVRILLCSHWDCRPYSDNDPDSTKYRKPVDGANDGASGVGILLEIARILKTKNPAVGVDILFLDSEDYGAPMFLKEDYSEDFWGLGAQYWAKNPHVPNYNARFGILLDMVGVPSGHFAHEGFSMQYAPDIVTKVWNAAYRAGYGNYFTDQQGGTVNDDHLYINKFIKIPTIDIIHYDPNTRSGFFQYWHTSKDNMESIDKATLRAVGQTLLTVIFEEGLPS